jgi:hypothetical protein
MDCSTGRTQGKGKFIAQDYGASGVVYEVGSVYGRMLKLSDVRKARGKLYRLEDVLMMIVLAKLCGEDRPSGIAEWAKNHQEALVQLLHWSTTCISQSQHLSPDLGVHCVSRRNRTAGGRVQSKLANTGRCMQWTAKRREAREKKRRTIQNIC